MYLHYGKLTDILDMAITFNCFY